MSEWMGGRVCERASGWVGGWEGERASERASE